MLDRLFVREWRLGRQDPLSTPPAPVRDGVPMSKAARATQALERAGIAFSLHRYDYDPAAGAGSRSGSTRAAALVA